VNGHPKNAPPLFVSDSFDFSIYVDADEAQVERWFSERFLTLRDTVFKDESSYFHRYAHLSTEEANLILEKGEDHQILRVRLRKL
jgi:type I pantothenate kinase